MGRQFKPGHIVAAGRTAQAAHGKQFRKSSQWIVYDQEFDNILVSKVLTPERYRRNQILYDLAQATEEEVFWVDARRFRFVWSHRNRKRELDEQYTRQSN